MCTVYLQEFQFFIMDQETFSYELGSFASSAANLSKNEMAQKLQRGKALIPSNFGKCTFIYFIERV